MSDIYLSLTETPTVVTLSQPVISGALSSTVTVANTVTVALDANSLSALENVTVTVGAAVSVSNFPSTQTVAGTVTANLNYDNFSGALTSYVEAVSNHNAFPVEIAYQPSVTIGSLPAISGTVTANVFGQHQVNLTLDPIPVDSYTNTRAVCENELIVPVQITNDSGTLNSSNPLPISGTVTANVNFSADLSGSNVPAPSQGIALGYLTDSQTFFTPVHEDQGLPVRIQGQSATQPISGTVTVGNSVTIGGTVTAAAPNGSLTTRFGTPTTANTAFATSAVTNASRKYLLIQNVTTGSNVITVGIGFTPTTTQGIQLTAGAGITFESSYIPTGAVHVLSSVTASNFTILEA